jgi:hypothetical protein
MNGHSPDKAKTTPREHALGMDRPPVGHAIQVRERWIGKVRSNGAVIWTSEPFATLAEAKRAVERQLAQSPELVESAVRQAEARFAHESANEDPVRKDDPGASPPSAFDRNFDAVLASF